MKLLEVLQLKEYSDLKIDEELEYDETKVSTLTNFLEFCINKLKLKENFSLIIAYDRERYKIKTTAYFDFNTNEIAVYAKNRMLGDVCRSVAHELTHLHQKEEDRIKFPVQDVGGEIEDEANAKAGALIKEFSYEDELGQNLFA